MWIHIPLKYLKRITIRHQKIAFKIGTIFAILTVAVCTLEKSNTFVINTETSADNTSELESTSSVHEILKQLVPAVDNCSDKTDATESRSFQGNTALHDSTSKTQNFTDTKNIQNTTENTVVKNLNNKTHTDEQFKSQPTNNTSHTLVTSEILNNKRSMLMQNTSKSDQQSEYQVTAEREQHLTKQLTMSQPDDMQVMQKQLNLTHCLLFYIEKEKMEYAKSDLWRVYVVLKSIPPNITTFTERRIMSVTKALTDWNIEDLTISKQLADELASTIETIRQLKNLLSITDVNIMRVVQYGCKFHDQLTLKQVVTNYESENALLRLQHELYVLRPKVVSSSNVVVPLLYYPLLQRYVSLLVDMFSAGTACLEVCNFV